MTTIQTVNKLVAREKEISEDLVESINSFYWKEVRRTLSNLEHTSVSIKHIGTITVSKRKVDQFIKKTILKIRGIRKSVKYKESTKAILLDLNFDRLRKALVQRNILAKQYYNVYMERAKRIRESGSNNSEPIATDSRGLNESDQGGV